MSRPPSARILVLIVTYQGEKWIRGCLEPFKEDREEIDILVVDNASTDSTCSIIEREYPFVRLHRSPINLGFGMANNIGLQRSLSEGYSGTLLLNQDAEISPSTVRVLSSRSAAYPHIGILSPVHLSSHSGEMERGFREYTSSCGEKEGSSPAIVSFVNAAIWYVPKRTVAQVGLFCPLFRHYGEDVDYANRVRACGLSIAYFNDLKGYHFRPQQSLSPEKAILLEEVYHLCEWINPLLSPLRQYACGPLALLLKALSQSLRIGSESGGSYWDCLRRLWSLRADRHLWLSRPAFSTDSVTSTNEECPCAPVALFVFNRPEHTRSILYDLLSQPECGRTTLYIFSDGARSDEDVAAVEQVRGICREVRGFADIHLIEHSSNIGLARNLTEGITYVLQRHSRVIVLEDDLHLSPYALGWTNEALRLYADIPEVSHINLGTFYAHPKLPSSFLSHFIGSWGWATWREDWEKYWEPDGSKLLSAYEANKPLSKLFDYNGHYPFVRMLRRQTLGQNQSWAVRWHASLVLHRQLSYNANPSLAANVGFDGTGTHCANDGQYITPVAPYPLPAKRIDPAMESADARRILTRYYRRHRHFAVRAYTRLKRIWRTLLAEG